MLIPVSVFADGKHKRSLADCTTFSEHDRDDGGGVDMSVASTCEAKLSCGINWTLTCAPGTKREKQVKQGYAFDLDNGQSDGTTASSDVCGDEAWSVGDVSWSCAPSK
jgi:hypothetical protein